MQISKEHFEEALKETIARYPDSIGSLIFFTTALGIREKDPLLADKEVMFWSAGSMDL